MLYRNCMDMLHDPFKILQPVSVCKSQPLDTSSIKLAEIYLSPGHLPVGFKLSASLGNIPVQQKTDGKDLRIVHFLKRIKSHIIFIMSYLKIRPGNVINRPKKFQSQFFLLLIIRNGETSGNFCRICLSKLLCIMLPGHSFLAVFFIVQIIYTKSHVLPLPF